MANDEPTRTGSDPDNDAAAEVTAPLPVPGQQPSASPWARPSGNDAWTPAGASAAEPTRGLSQPGPTRVFPQPEPTRPIAASGTPAGAASWPPPSDQAYSAPQAPPPFPGAYPQTSPAAATGQNPPSTQSAQNPYAAGSYGPYPPASYPPPSAPYGGYGTSQQNFQPPGTYYAGQQSPGQGYYSPQHLTTGTQPPKRRWPIAMLALVLVLLLGVGGYAALRQDSGSAATDPGSSVTVDPQTEPQTWPSDEPSTGTSNQPTSSRVTSAEAQGVVLIDVTTADGAAAGTGMVLTADGKVLTNYHVVAGSTKVAVTIAATGDTYSAKVLGFDQTRDVALLQLTDASGLATVTTDDDTAAVGDAIAAVGNAEGRGELVKAPGKIDGLDQSLTVSSDSPWKNTEDLSGMIRTSAGAVPGDSGGPMFDSESEVVGMTTAGSTKEGDSYAVPIATALSVVQQIESGQDAGTVRVGPSGYLGVTVRSYTGSDSATVSGVTTDGPAAKAGITAGSRITRIGDTTITTKTNVANVIRALEPGSTVTIQWETPSGNTKTAQVTLGSSPVN